MAQQSKAYPFTDIGQNKQRRQIMQNKRLNFKL